MQGSNAADQHIIYIDDSPVELQAVAGALSAAGYRVTCKTGIEGIEPCLRTAELVLVDYHMPGLNGREVLVALRRMSATLTNPPAYYLYTSDKLQGGDYKQLGFDGRIIMKGNLEALLKQVRSALRVRALKTLRG